MASLRYESHHVHSFHNKGDGLGLNPIRSRRCVRSLSHGKSGT
jgi:hypothetical protein